MRQTIPIVQMLFRCLPLLFMPAWAFALNLGDINLKSEPGEPLEAEISVSDVAADEQESLRVGLADVEGFRWADIEWSPQLNRLQFELQHGADGSQSIRIYTAEALQMARLHFLLQVAWSRGRVFREYLLEFEHTPDRSGARQAELPPQPDVLAITRAPDEDWGAIRAAVREHHNYQVSRGDTLWEIARELRPDASVSIQQMMLALLRANPEAFSHNNINWLAAGAVLWMPGAAELQALTTSQAYAEVLAQNNVWRQARAAATVVAQAQATPATVADTELRLVPVTEEDLEGARAASPDDTAQAGELVQANRQVEELTRENTELEDKLSKSESTIDDLRRLIEFKDDELAALQEETLRAQAEPGPGLPERLQSLFTAVYDFAKGRWWVLLVALTGLLILVAWWFLRRRSAYPQGLSVPAASIRPDFPQVIKGEATEGSAGQETQIQEDAEQGDGEDEAWSKIELAQAYLDLGDTENVRAILHEVLAEGNAAQREAARQLLEQVGSG